MSRIGKKPVAIPAGVKVDVNGSNVSAKGPAGELALSVHPLMQVVVDGAVVTINRPDDKRSSRALHGLTRKEEEERGGRKRKNGGEQYEQRKRKKQGNHKGRE